MRSFNKHVILVIFSLLVSCKSTKNIGNDQYQKVPVTYPGLSDSLNSANLLWQNYFGDTLLKNLIDVALKNNLDLLSALEKLKSLNISVAANKAALFPSVNLNTSIAQRKYGLYTMDGAGNISTEITSGQIVPIHLPDLYIGLQTNWEADIWGRLQNKKKAAIMHYFSGVEGKNVMVTNLVAVVANSYFELQSLDSELKLIGETIKLYTDALDLVNELKIAGRANDVVVNQFKAQLLNVQAYEKDLLQSILVLENRINFLLGRFPESIKRKELDLRDTLYIKPKVGIPSQLMQNRPDIREAEFDLLASKANVKAARAAFYPTFNITGSLGFQAFNPVLLFTAPQSVAYSLLGGLITPLINKSAIRAEFKTANALQQDALYKYQKSVLTGYVEVYNEMKRLSSLNEKFDLKTEEVNSLQISSNGALELFKTGRANYLEVLNAQQSVLRSKIEMIGVRKQQLYTLSNIYKALGGGWK